MYYTEPELDTIINRTRTISSNPNKLYAAYSISCLSEYLVEDGAVDDMWGMKTDAGTLKRLVEDIATDFVAAIENGIAITVFGSQYTIRNKGQFISQSIGSIFDFEISDGMAIISKKRVRNTESVSKMESPADIKSYFRKIVFLAEDDENDGWNKLTDMEIVYYCWGAYYYSSFGSDFDKFLSDYSEYIFVEKEDIIKTWSDKCLKSKEPNGIFTFSKRKIESYNMAHGQKSIVENVSKKKSERYWPKSTIAAMIEE